jgi:hypothetical protein
VSPIQRILIVSGLAILAVGLAWPWIARLGLGHLPGDVILRRGGVTFYAPIVTCILISVVLSAVLWLARR